MESQLQVKNSIQTLSEKQNPKQEISSNSSSSSSPSHDFSFTISLQPKHTNTTPSYQNTNPFALDLSPADEIFFHGHLLPLHLLSHLPISPRTSTSSYDAFTLPIKDNNAITKPNINNSNKDHHKLEEVNVENRIKTKPIIKPFSLFNFSKWRKGFEDNDEEKEKQQEQQNQKKKLLSHGLKKYIRMLFQRRENVTQWRKRQSFYSFSSVLSSKGSRKTMENINEYNKREVIRGKRGDLFSAPASMRTSPTNSGHLRVSPAGLSLSSASTSTSSSDSTMEELQAAIQAAIAHCKNSSAVVEPDDDKVKDS